MNLNQYGATFNEVVNDYKTEYETKAKKAEAAQAAYKTAHSKDPEGANTLSAQAEAMRQNDALRAFKKEAPGRYLAKLEEMRGRLEADAKAAFAVNPAAVDTQAMALLSRPEMLTASDYTALYNGASSITMKRIIGHAAKSAATELPAGPEREELAIIAAGGAGFTVSSYLDKWDTLTDVFQRGLNNYTVLKKWDEITGEAIKDF